MKNLLVLFLFVAPFANAQSELDSILLLNGKVYKGTVVGLEHMRTDSVLTYKDEKGEVEHFETYRIFSYTQKGVNSIIYQKNEVKGNFLDEKQAREVTYGSFDARQTFKPHVPFWSGFALGLSASLSDTYLTKKEASSPNLVAPLTPGFFKRSPSWFPFAVPVVVPIIWSFPSFKLKEKKVVHKEFYLNENYYRGYHRIARQKRMLSSLIGSLSGIASGLVIHYIAQ
jgi:hypothetical protein